MRPVVILALLLPSAGATPRQPTDSDGTVRHSMVDEWIASFLNFDGSQVSSMPPFLVRDEAAAAPPATIFQPPIPAIDAEPLAMPAIDPEPLSMPATPPQYEWPGLVGGFDFVFLQPRFDNNTAFVTTQWGIAGNAVTKQNFTYATELSPRVWLGYVGPRGFGGRVRYWEFDHSADPEFFAGNASSSIQGVPVPQAASILDGVHGGFNESVAASSGLDAYTLDAELTQKIPASVWRVDLGGGVRHASLDQDYTATVVDSSGAFKNSATRRHRFDGVGPTIFAEVRRPILDSSLAVFALGRASILFGETKFVGIDAHNSGVVHFARFEDEGTLRIGEIQVGGEWSHLMSCGTSAFVRVALEAQIWEEAGNANGPNGDDLGLVGFHVGLGLQR